MKLQEIKRIITKTIKKLMTEQQSQCFNNTKVSEKPPITEQASGYHQWEVCSMTLQNNPGVSIAASWIGAFSFAGLGPISGPGIWGPTGTLNSFYGWVVSQVGSINIGDTITFDMGNSGMCSWLGHIWIDTVCFKYKGIGPVNVGTIWGGPTATAISSDCCSNIGRGVEDRGCMDQNALNYNECCNGDPNCTVVGSNPECCKYDRRTGDERGCIDPNATNNGECCPGNNYPGCVATLHHEPCCKYEGGGEEKKCTCCKKIEGGTIQGISMATQIPISDSCSQFNNPPLLYGCTDSTLWSLSKCSQELPNDDWPIGLDESIIRMQKLANIK